MKAIFAKCLRTLLVKKELCLEKKLDVNNSTKQPNIKLSKKALSKELYGKNSI